MLALYLTSLLVGGVFVGLSVFAGADKDTDGSADKDFGSDSDFDHDVDHSLGHDHEFDCDVDGDLDGDFDGDADVGSASLADASHGGKERPKSSKKKNLWLPFMSFRFWTFGACFFGLTGSLLTGLALTPVPLTLVVASAFGVGVGGVASSLVHFLRKPVSPETIRVSDYSGQVGELIAPLREGGITKISFKIGHREREMLAVAEEPCTLSKGTRVVITGLNDRGHARIVVESKLYLTEES